MRTYWPVMLSTVIAVAVSLRLWGQTSGGAVRISRATLKVPVVGELRRKIALSRFARDFASLHSAGLEMAPSLSLVGRLIGNAYLSQRFEMAVQRVMAGESLSRALKAVGEFPPIVIQMTETQCSRCSPWLMRRARCGFTLLELVVVIAVIGILALAVTPAAAPFSFSNVPMGVRAIRVVRTVNPQAGAVVAQDTIVVRPSSTTASELWF